MAKPLTDAAIQRYKPTGKVREISDPGYTGLRLVIQTTGSKSFVLRFRRPGGGFAKLTLGSYDGSGQIDGTPVVGQPLTLRAARALAACLNRDRAMKIDVLDKHRKTKSQQKTAKIDREANAFGAALVAFFIDHRTKKGARPRRWREDAAQLGLRYAPGADPKIDQAEIIRGSLANLWADRPIAEIDSHDVHRAVDAAKKQNDARGRKTVCRPQCVFRLGVEDSAASPAILASGSTIPARRHPASAF